jgi:hypothetical protein
MAKKKRPSSESKPEQLVVPFQLRVGDVILEDGARAEVVGRPTNATNRMRKNSESVGHVAHSQE